MVFFLSNVFILEAKADILYLKNGRNITGLIEKEDEEKVVLDIGFGTVTFRVREIKDIYRSSPDEVKVMYREWQRNKKSEEGKWVEVKKAREEARRKKEFEPKEVEFSRDAGQILVNALVNKKIKAKFLLDTGASIVLLSNRIAEQLGIDIYGDEKDSIEVQMADGSKVAARYIVLDSISVEGVEAKNVEAVVLEEDTEIDVRDGLLGMSFLNKFNFQIDSVKQKLILKKLKK